MIKMPIKTMMFAVFRSISHNPRKMTTITLEKDISSRDTGLVRETAIKGFKQMKDAIACVFPVLEGMRIWVEKAEAEKSIEILEDFPD